MKDEDERPNILISHINLHDDESVHCYNPYNSKLLSNSQNTLCFPSKILHKQTVLISLGSCIIVLRQDACLCKVVEGKQRVLFVCLFTFGKRPITRKLFKLKCLCYETF